MLIERYSKITLEADMKFLIFAGVTIFGAVGVYGQAPGWSRGQQELAITYEECLKRASSSLTAEGHRIDNAAGNFAVGIKGVHTSVIICNPLPNGRNVVNIVVASNGEGGGSLRQALQARMEGNTAVGQIGGCQGTNGYSISISNAKIRAGQTVAAQAAVPGGAPDNNMWIGLFPAHGTGHVGQWSYLFELKNSSFTKNFSFPSAGAFEIRLFQDSGYDKVMARCFITVE